jgi:hypothetical protein
MRGDAVAGARDSHPLLDHHRHGITARPDGQLLDSRPSAPADPAADARLSRWSDHCDPPRTVSKQRRNPVEQWLAAMAAVTALSLALPAATCAGSPSQEATPVARAVELMEALKHHRYGAACAVYDPLYWEMVGYAARDCASVLAKAFPSSEPVAYRVHYGATVAPRTAVVIVSMALADAAPICDRAWQDGLLCPRGSPYYLELTEKTLQVDWQGRKPRPARSRWYISSVGGV